MEDCELLKRLKNNDAKAFEELFQSYFTALFNYAKFYTGSSQLAEDLVHDVFCKIWESGRTLAIHTSIKSYLYRSVYNKCIQYLRHQKVVLERNEDQQTMHEEALLMNRFCFETGLSRLYEKEISQLVECTISKLPEKTREIFILSRNMHQKNSEIAKKYYVSEKAVEYHISQAMIFLRERLKDYLPGIMILVYGNFLNCIILCISLI